MIGPPIAGPIKCADPDAQALLLGLCFFPPVSAIGNGKTFRHHDGAEIAIGNRATSQEAIVAVPSLGLAMHSSRPEQGSHAIARHRAAGPITVGTSAVLAKLWRVEAGEANAIVAKPETVAIAGPRPSVNGGQRLVEQHSGDSNTGQNDQCQNPS